MKFLLDTNVISEQIRQIPDEKVLQWLERNDSYLYLSAISVAELKKGMAMLPAGKKKDRLNFWFKEVVANFEGRIFAFDQEAGEVWGEMYARVQSLGHKLPVIDSFNAAIALHHGLIMATRNEKDFAGTGVRLINPWNQ